jgi:hypothetical protein
MGLLTVAELRGLVSTGLGDEALQGVIDREEAYLASRIGPLTGERTQRLVMYATSGPIRLARPTDSVVVRRTPTGDVIDGTEVLPGGWHVWRPALDWPYPGTRGSSLYATYTPNDEDLVVRVLIELCRMTVSAAGAAAAGLAAGLKGETIGQYHYEVDAAATPNRSGTGPSRAGLVKSLLGPQYPSSMRLRSLATDPWRTWPPLR